MSVRPDPLSDATRDLISAALKYDDERNGLAIAGDARPDLADAVLAFRHSRLPAMPDRWARIYLGYTANPSWSDVEIALEPAQGGHIAVVRYTPVFDSVQFIGGAE